MAPSHLILFLLLSVITEVHPRSFGAPTEACADILPLGHINAGFSSMDVSTIPYALNLSVFDLDGGISYVPGMTYTSKSNTHTTIMLASIAPSVATMCTIMYEHWAVWST